MPQPGEPLAVTRALLSVSDKTGLVELAQALVRRGVELYSTGGTRAHLQEHGLPVQEVAQYTGFPEMMHGRVKTLHPKIFAGILRRADVEEDQRAMREHGIVSFELVVVNLYPFEQTVAQPGVSVPEAIEQIDIGGPSLVRAAAKNFRFTGVLTSPEQYADVIEELETCGGLSLPLRQRLAAEAFAHTADYDRAIANWFAQLEGQESLPSRWQLSLRQAGQLRYGENPHLAASLYRAQGLPPVPGSLLEARQLHGKELSYNNYLDLDAAWRTACSFEQPAAVVVKHTNPCGAAVAAELPQAIENALAGDPQSAFGGIVGVNRPVDEAAAEQLAQAGFLEAIIAPAFEPVAVELLTTRPSWRRNVRLVEVGQLLDESRAWHLRSIAGGLLVQQADRVQIDRASWNVPTETPVPEELWPELEFAWQVVAQVKSNAIVLARHGVLVGVGAGQMSRVDAVRIAIEKAGPRARGAVLASDAFFPFADSVHLAAEAGVVALVQPGGSKRDGEVIAACNQHRLPMVLTGRRHFRH